MILTKEQLHDALVERHGADIQANVISGKLVYLTINHFRN